MLIGTQIRRQRQARGWSQEALAACIKVTQSTISRIEQNQQAITLIQLKMLAQAFEITVQDLLAPNPERDTFKQ